MGIVGHLKILKVTIPLPIWKQKAKDAIVGNWLWFLILVFGFGVGVWFFFCCSAGVIKEKTVDGGGLAGKTNSPYVFASRHGVFHHPFVLKRSFFFFFSNLGFFFSFFFFLFFFFFYFFLFPFFPPFL